MKVFNTLTNKKEDFVPIKENEVSMYVCGPTVYNHAHIGNTRPMIVFDVLKRTFEYLGYKVTFVSNFTDVDDKIIKAAKEEGITERELTDKYIKAYEDEKEWKKSIVYRKYVCCSICCLDSTDTDSGCTTYRTKWNRYRQWNEDLKKKMKI